MNLQDDHVLGEIEQDIEDEVQSNNNYKKYAELKSQIKKLTNEAKELEYIILDDLLERDGNKLETPYATFSMYSKNKWEYSDDLQLKEKAVKNKIKLLKKKEEVDGVAIQVAAKSIIRCQLAKEIK